MAKLKVWLTAETKQFSRAMKRADKQIGKWAREAKRYAAVGGAAVAALGVQSVRAFSKQENAVNSLASALATNGDAVNTLLPKYEKFASQIQSQTTFGDEAILAQMAMIRNLGVMPDKMEEATKGAIGLSKALGLDSNAAARYTALAMQGEYTILQRYVPALRTATTAAEKQAIVTDLMNKGYQQAQEEANTTAGRLTQLKNAYGDVTEGIGQVITEVLTLEGGAEGLTKKMSDMAETIKSNAPQWAFMFKSMWTEAKFAFKKAWTVASGLIENIGTGILVVTQNITTSFKWVAKNWREILFGMYKFSGETWKAIAKAFAETMFAGIRIVGRQFEDMWTAIKKRDFKSIAAAANIGDDILEQFNVIKSSWKDVVSSVSTDLEIAPPVFSVPEYRNIVKDAEKIDADKEKRLAKLREQLMKKLTKQEADEKAKQIMATAQKEREETQEDTIATAQRQREETLSDQFLRIGGIVGGRATEQETTNVWLERQTSYQKRIAMGITELVSLRQTQQPVFP